MPSSEAPARRDVYLLADNLMRPKVHAYSLPCLQSLFRNSVEELSLTVVIGTAADRDAMAEAIASLPEAGRHQFQVFDAAAAAERAADKFAKYPNLRFLQSNHPCWKKVTDPLLFAPPDSEIVIIDPDVYFPNPFRFEPTPETGLLVMWQPPNCLSPELVRKAFEAGIPLADHVDIGVCNTRSNTDLDWLDWLVGKLGGPEIPVTLMHLEPVIWAALGMRVGGGYLDPKAWYCWYYDIGKRIKARLGSGARKIMTVDGGSMAEVKCFHATGVAKNWLAEAFEIGLFDTGVTEPRPATPPLPYKPYTQAKFDKKMKMQDLMKSMGVYKLVYSGR